MNILPLHRHFPETSSLFGTRLAAAFTARFAVALTMLGSLIFSGSTQAQGFRLPGRLGQALQNVDRVLGGQGRNHDHGYDEFYRGEQWETEPVVQEPPRVCPIVQPVHPQPVQPVPEAREPEEMTEQQAQLAKARTIVARAKRLFKSGEYAKAKSELDAVVMLLPTDSNVYQFRSAAWFAMGDFEKSAADAYDSIKLGNLWNWSAMVNVYGNAETYTSHLRKLEAVAKSDDKTMAPHFLLAYHYLVLNHLQHGEKQLTQVLKINPEEEVSQKLLAVVQQRQQTQTAAK